MHLSLRSVTRRFAAGPRTAAVDALGPLDTEVEAGGFTAIIGPSGCGKSTLLRLVAGLDRPDSGAILLDGVPVTEPVPQCGMVFQQFALFPWLTIRRNVGFGLSRAHGADAIVEQLLLDVGLSAFADHYPRSLSGGMQQRAALARALARQPQLLLLDEPFGSLDQQTRVLMQELLEMLWHAETGTVLMVTHDIEEALFLADRIIVLSARPGRILESVQVGFARPRRTELRVTPEFIALKARISGLLRQQVPALVDTSAMPAIQ